MKCSLQTAIVLELFAYVRKFKPAHFKTEPRNYRLIYSYCKNNRNHIYIAKQLINLINVSLCKTHFKTLYVLFRCHSTIYSYCMQIKETCISILQLTLEKVIKTFGCMFVHTLISHHHLY